MSDVCASIRLLLLVAPIVVQLPGVGGPCVLAEDRISFSRQIRPLLSDRCFQCHGPDSVSREADLRFDHRDSVLGDRDEAPIVVPGSPDESALVARIFESDPDLKMPPADSGRSLTKAEAELIRQWVAQGAQWEEHWAWIPPERPEPPIRADDHWSLTPIDRFVDARLTDAGLQPAPGADRYTLLRRATQDLTGLPPGPDEISAFVNDDSEQAWDTVITRLLSSPRYGEKMALPWLEAARYADTSGFTEDYGRFMYPWRTWVIEAFNANMPYDEFVTDQLAGDLKPDATRQQILATGFNRNHRINQEVGALDEEFIVEYAVDRLETIGTVFLGMTIGCARCHDHKYDPVSQKEFYQLYAFFNNNDDIGVDHQSRFGFARPFIEWPTREQKQQRRQRRQQLKTLQEQTTPPQEQLADADRWMAAFDAAESIGLEPWYSLGPFDHEQPTRVTGFRFPYFDEPHVDLQQTVQQQTWTVRPNWKSGTVMVPGGEFSTIYLYRRIHAPADGEYVLDIGASDSVTLWLNGEMIFDRLDEGDNVATATPFPVTLNAGSNELLVKMSNGDFVQQITFRSRSHTAYPASIFHLLRRPAAERTPEQQNELLAHFHQTQIEAAQAQVKEIDRQIAKVMVMKERADVRPAHILERGHYASPGELVQRDVPAVFPPLTDNAPRNRLGLAQWLTSSQHPLTARVAVNRIWQNHFGRGLVRTEEDFGVQGAYPTHPDLLDWLATELIQSGWDMQHIHRLIMQSAVYQQSSAATAVQQTKDPQNHLLSRAPRFRLRPQEIRDHALYASGLLVEQQGGPSVFPYQPPGLWREITSLKLQPEWFLTVDYRQGHGADLYRRSLYIFWKRSVPPPGMTVFDAETREVCVVRRQNSNTPLQAMNLLNDVTYVEAARHLAHRMLREGGESTNDRFNHGLLLTNGRPGTEEELHILTSGLQQQAEYYLRHPDQAQKLLSAGESGIPGSHKPTILAAWTQMGLLLLNRDEAITRN